MYVSASVPEELLSEVTGTSTAVSSTSRSCFDGQASGQVVAAEHCSMIESPSHCRYSTRTVDSQRPRKRLPASIPKRNASLRVSSGKSLLGCPKFCCCNTVKSGRISRFG